MLVDNAANNIAAYRNASIQSSVRTLEVSGSYLEITGGASGAKATDDADFSEKAKELLNRIKELDVFKIIYPNSDPRQKTKSLDEVKNDFLGDFNNFASAFGDMSALMGLSASSSFTMGLDGAGGMTVKGSDSATAGKLQQAFNQNSTLVSRFAVMAARASLVDAGNTLGDFKDSYAKDPVGAIKDNIDALKERLLGFRTEAGGGTMNYGFMREFSFKLEYSSTSVSYTKTSAADADENADETDSESAASDNDDAATVKGESEDAA